MRELFCCSRYLVCCCSGRVAGRRKLSYLRKTVGWLIQSRGFAAIIITRLELGELPAVDRILCFSLIPPDCQLMTIIQTSTVLVTSTVPPHCSQVRSKGTSSYSTRLHIPICTQCIDVWQPKTLIHRGTWHYSDETGQRLDRH